MSEVITGITGVLLAGGKSRRMGQDKRFLELEGSTLLQLSLSVMEHAFSETLVVLAEPSPDLSRLGHRVVTDLIPNCASLGGLYTGLSYASHPHIFVAACDMPFLDARVISAMVGVDPTADVVMAKLSQGLQPMHAVYSKRCLARLETMARDHKLKIQDIVAAQELSVRLMSEDELSKIDPQLLSFMNVNTPADLEFARKLLSRRGVGEGSHG